MAYEKKNLNKWIGTLKSCNDKKTQKVFFAGYIGNKPVIAFQDHVKGNYQLYAEAEL